MNVLGKRPGGLSFVLPCEQQQRRFTGGRSDDGGFWMEIDGTARLTLTPQQTVNVAVAMLRSQGIDIQLDTRRLPG